MRNQRFLRRKAASAYMHETHGVDRAPGTLAKLAVIGGGPVFRRAGRVPLYSTDDLDEWVASILSPPVRSTSELASAPGIASAESKLNSDAPTKGLLSARDRRSET